MSNEINKLRILTLHGHGMNADIFKSKIGFLRSETKKFVDWVFLDAPISLPSPPTSSTVISSGETSSPAASPSAVLRTWYDFTESIQEKGVELPRYKGMEECLSALDHYVRSNGPFHGIFSFSQGTVVSALWLSRLLTQPQRPSHVPMFAIFVSGLLPRDPQYRLEILNEGPAAVQSIKTVHCVGLSDNIILPSQSEELMKLPIFQSNIKEGSPWCEKIEHDGGHVVPSSIRKALKLFLQAQQVMCSLRKMNDTC